LITRLGYTKHKKQQT